MVNKALRYCLQRSWLCLKRNIRLHFSIKLPLVFSDSCCTIESSLKFIHEYISLWVVGSLQMIIVIAELHIYHYSDCIHTQWILGTLRQHVKPSKLVTCYWQHGNPCIMMITCYWQHVNLGITMITCYWQHVIVNLDITMITCYWHLLITPSYFVQFSSVHEHI